MNRKFPEYYAERNEPEIVAFVFLKTFAKSYMKSPELDL